MLNGANTNSINSLPIKIKFIVVTGGVLSGIGKGIIASSTGRILRSNGFRVTAIKIDPYINIDAGTMSPFEHGEVFVLNDGGEVDLDLGNYERFLDIELCRDNNITTGKIYDMVIKRERKGEYLGKTVQVVPHIVNEIQDWISRVTRIPSDGLPGSPNICIIELGGTVGDIESMPFIEALRQFQFRVGRENICIIHVSLVPVLASGEQKTKPTQQSMRDLRALGLNPDIIMCRSASPITLETKSKISSFCHVAESNVLGVHDVSNIYRVPHLLENQKLFRQIQKVLDLPDPPKKSDLHEWLTIADTADILSNSIEKGESVINVAIVGKYTGLADSYLSVIRAIQHASYYTKIAVVIECVEASYLEEVNKDDDIYKSSFEKLKKADAIIVPGGFGDRGIEGMIATTKYARENNIPFLGICLGMQIAVIETARSCLGWKDATSSEFSTKSDHPVIVFMPEISRTHMGGTMRLGKRRTFFKSPESFSYRLYKYFYYQRQLESEITNEEQGFNFIDERHRHRYEVNPEFVNKFSSTPLDFVGQDESGQRQEIIEVKDHPFFVGIQFHPEFLSHPTRPSPLFVGILLAATGKLNPWLDVNSPVIPLD